MIRLAPGGREARSFLLLEEHRADQTARIQGAHALVAGRGVASSPPSPPAAPPAVPDANNGGRARGGRGRRRGRGNGNGNGTGGAPPPHAPPRVPGLPALAPGSNSWTGLVQA